MPSYPNREWTSRYVGLAVVALYRRRSVNSLAASYWNVASLAATLLPPAWLVCVTEVKRPTASCTYWLTKSWMPPEILDPTIVPPRFAARAVGSPFKS